MPVDIFNCNTLFFSIYLTVFTLINNLYIFTLLSSKESAVEHNLLVGRVISIRNELIHLAEQLFELEASNEAATPDDSAAAKQQ